MKKFLKFILIFVLVIVLIVGATVGTVLFIVSDKTNEVEVDKYKEQALQEAIATPLNDALSKMKDTYSLTLSLTENDINNIIYALIKEKINPDYNPKTGTTDKELYVYSGIVLPGSIPVVGGKSVSVNSIYAKLDGDYITLNATANAVGMVKSRFHVTFKVETSDNEYRMFITEAKLGKINLIGKTAKKAMDKGDTEESLNDYFKKNNIPFKYIEDDMKLVGTKEEVNNWLIGLLVKENEEGLKKEFVNLLLSPENDLIALNSRDNRFELSVDLARLQVSSEDTTLNSEISKEFNQDVFIQGKSQTYIVNCMTGNHTITFTELEINKLLYSNTNGYSGLGQSMNLIEGVPFEFKVDGIIFDINDLTKDCKVTVILNINGLLTTAIVTGAMDDTTGDISINLDEYVTLGRDFRITSSVITDLMSGAFGSDAIISFNKETNSLDIKKEIMTNMLSSAGADGGAKMEVERMVVVANGIKAYIAYNDTELEATVADVVSAAEAALANDFVDETQFNTEDEEQQEAVEALMEELSSVSEILSDPEQELTEEDADALIEAINNLSEENQQALYEQFASEIGEEDLQRLYEQMFGGGNN